MTAAGAANGGPGREAAVLAIDLGTTEVKVGLVALDGRLLGLGRAGYATDADPATGRAEQDPEAWWGAIGLATRELVRLDVGDIVAIGIDGHGPTLVAVDASGRPTHPALIWQDTRAVAEQAELAEVTGLQGWSLAGLPSALWLERNHAAAAAATRSYLATWDFVALRLTGVAATSLAHGQPFPDPAVLDAAGLPAAKVPPAIDAGTVVGTVTAEVGAALGVRPGIPVVAGIVDAWASYHGAGMTRAGDAMDPGGSAGGFGVYWDRPLVVPGSYSTIAPLPGLYSRRRRDGRDRPSRGLVPGRRAERQRHDGDPDRGGGRDPGRLRRRRLPALPRRRALAAVGSDRPRGVRRAGPRSRSRRT